MAWHVLRFLSSCNHARWSIRSMLLLTSMVAYLMCLALYLWSEWVTGVRLGLSALLIVGLGQQLQIRKRLDPESTDSSASKRTIPLLVLLVAILVTGFLTLLTEWHIRNQSSLFLYRENMGIWYRGWSTSWTLSLFLSSLTSPWMTDKTTWSSKAPSRFQWKLGIGLLSCISLLAVSAISNGINPAMVLIVCNSMLMRWNYPASASAGILEDRDIRLVGIESTAGWLMALWCLAVVGYLGFLASLTTRKQMKHWNRWVCRLSLMSLVGGLVANAWIIGWWLRRVSPPFANSLAEMPAVLFLAPLVSALVIAMYFVTRFQHQSDSVNSLTASVACHDTPLTALAGDTAISSATKTRWMSDSVWVGILFMAFSFPEYREIGGALFEFQGSTARLMNIVESAIAHEDTRLDLLLSAYGLQWMIRRSRRMEESAQRWPSLALVQRWDYLIAWLFLINLLLCTVPFGIAFWFL